jgi:uncharacterized protein (TIGR03437 family)
MWLYFGVLDSGLRVLQTPVGMETPSDATYNTANVVSVLVGGMPATVYGAALAPGFAGLYQIAIQVPTLANGDYPVVAVAGVSSPAQTMMTVQQYRRTRNWSPQKPIHVFGDLRI